MRMSPKARSASASTGHKRGMGLLTLVIVGALGTLPPGVDARRPTRGVKLAGRSRRPRQERAGDVAKSTCGHHGTWRSFAEAVRPRRAVAAAVGRCPRSRGVVVHLLRAGVRDG